MMGMMNMGATGSVKLAAVEAIAAGAALTLFSTDDGLLARPVAGLTEVLLAPAEQALSLLRVDFGKVAEASLNPLPAMLRPIHDLGRPMSKKRVVFSENMSMAGGKHSMGFLVNGQVTPAPYRAWNDIVNLRSGETVRVKMVQHFKGIRMFHCHILEHEGAGMMGQLQAI